MSKVPRRAILRCCEFDVPGIGGIGIGSTGPVDSVTGRIHNPYTLPNWDGIPIIDYIVERFQKPARLLGDCDVAALGEYWRGAGRGSRHMLYLTVGTGIGGGIIEDGKLHRGVGMVSSEPGHHVQVVVERPRRPGRAACPSTARDRLAAITAL